MPQKITRALDSSDSNNQHRIALPVPRIVCGHRYSKPALNTSAKFSKVPGVCGWFAAIELKFNVDAISGVPYFSF